MTSFLFGTALVAINLLGMFAMYRSLRKQVSDAEYRLHNHQEWLHNTATEQSQMTRALDEQHKSHQTSEEQDPLLEAARGL